MAFALSFRNASGARFHLAFTNPVTHRYYYIATAGNDSWDGLSPTFVSGTNGPWATVAKVNAHTRLPGDVFSFKGGDTFTATGITASTSGTSGGKIVYQSFGTGKATIVPTGASPGVTITAEYLQFIDLICTPASGALGGSISGSNSSGTVRLRGVEFIRCESSHGCSLAATGNYGFEDPLVEDCNFSNGSIGFKTTAPAGVRAHLNVTVRNLKALDNSQVGISLRGVQTGLVELSELARCGAGDDRNACEVYDSTAVVVRRNEAHHQTRLSTGFGGGFALMDGCVNCVVEENWSHDNAGAGYMLLSDLGTTHDGNIVRRNISQDDGAVGSNIYGCVRIGHSGATACTNFRVYQNTFYASASNGIVFRLTTADDTGIIANNLIIARNGARVVVAETFAGAAVNPTGVLFRGNLYDVGSAPLPVRWNSISYALIASWQTATTQEQISGSGVAITSAVHVRTPGGGGTTNGYNPAALSAYKLVPTSPAIDAGLDLAALFSITQSTADFFGAKVPMGSAADIGASEYGLALATSLTASATVTPPQLKVRRPLAAALTASAVVTAALKIRRPLVATLTGAATVTPQLRIRRPLVVSLTSTVSGAAPNLKILRSLSVSLTASATVTVKLKVRRPLKITLNASATVTAALHSPANYFIAAAGNDTWDGRAQTFVSGTTGPWKTVAKVNAQTPFAGDTYSFKGGETFTDAGLRVVAGGGTAGARVVYQSFGTGKATIDPPGSDTAVDLYDVEYIRVRDLALVGPNNGTGDGARAYMDVPVQLRGIEFINLDIVGFKHPSYIRSDAAANGYTDVLWDGVDTHDGGGAGHPAGIASYGPTGSATRVHQNVTVRNSKANRILGSGIRLENVNVGLVETSEANDNGDGVEPCSGIVCDTSTAVVIRKNRAQRTAAGVSDGNGISLDTNSIDCVAEYNYTEENEGAGVLVISAGTGTHSGAIVRRNVSSNDGVALQPAGGITIDHYTGMATITGLQVYQNTVYSTLPDTACVQLAGLGIAGTVATNILYATGSARHILAERLDGEGIAPPVDFRGNAYQGTPSIRWDDIDYSSIAAWQGAAPTQEKISGVTIAQVGDVKFREPGLLYDEDGVYALEGYKLNPGSVAIDTGVNVFIFGMTQSLVDFFGAKVPIGGAPDIGAVESGIVLAVSLTASATVTPSLMLHKSLQVALAASAIVTPALRLLRPLAVVLDASATISAFLSVGTTTPRALGVLLTASGDLFADLHVTRPLVVALSASAVLSAALGVVRPLAVLLTAEAIITAALGGAPTGFVVGDVAVTGGVRWFVPLRRLR